MLKNIINLLILNFDRFLRARHFIKLHFFNSPMSENISILYKIHFLKAKFFFKIRNHNHKTSFHKESFDFNKFGFTTFSNIEINNNSKIILNKLIKNSKVWDSRNSFKDSPSFEFKKELINIFKYGVDEFIKQTFNSDYSIFFHTLYKSERELTIKKPEGSELWHADGGPGICMNLMICHTPLNQYNGAMKIIPWADSKILLNRLFFEYKRLTRNKLNKKKFSNLDRISQRKIKCDLLKKFINDNSLNYFQPNSTSSGTIYAFRNNCVHAGGYTEIGFQRIVSLMHIYPSTKKTSIEEKFSQSHIKLSGYPVVNSLV